MRWVKYLIQIQSQMDTQIQTHTKIQIQLQSQKLSCRVAQLYSCKVDRANAPISVCVLPSANTAVNPDSLFHVFASVLFVYGTRL